MGRAELGHGGFAPASRNEQRATCNVQRKQWIPAVSQKADAVAATVALPRPKRHLYVLREGFLLRRCWAMSELIQGAR